MENSMKQAISKFEQMIQAVCTCIHAAMVAFQDIATKNDRCSNQQEFFNALYNCRSSIAKNMIENMCVLYPCFLPTLWQALSFLAALSDDTYREPVSEDTTAETETTSRELEAEPCERQFFESSLRVIIQRLEFDASYKAKAELFHWATFEQVLVQREMNIKAYTTSLQNNVACVYQVTATTTRFVLINAPPWYSGRLTMKSIPWSGRWRSQGPAAVERLCHFSINCLVSELNFA